MNPPENQAHSCVLSTDPPTEPMLSLDAEVIEDQLITISCTVESFPQSRLTLTRTSISNSQASEWHSPQHDYYEDHNTLHLKFNVTLTDTGLYTCNAENDEGLSKSLQRKMVVKCELFGGALSCLSNKSSKPEFSINLIFTRQRRTTLFIFSMMKSF